ncbi:MAG: hypothetical protein HRK26_00855 [Rickettsiaceae bacterium H1]|nr:hypothetical protein [Rickettsiaceae bacterium H1]
MKKIYVKLSYLFFLCLSLLFYYLNTSTFKEQIELDNSIIKWRNELLTDKKQELISKIKGMEHYDRTLTHLSSINQIIEDLLNLKNDQLENLKINPVGKNNKDCVGDLCLSWSEIKISFTYYNDEYASSFIENLKNINRIVIKQMDIEKVDQQKKSVNLLAQSYSYER